MQPDGRYVWGEQTRVEVMGERVVVVAVVVVVAAVVAVVVAVAVDTGSSSNINTQCCFAPAAVSVWGLCT